jgi:hypothetical protein
MEAFINFSSTALSNVKDIGLLYFLSIEMFLSLGGKERKNTFVLMSSRNGLILLLVDSKVWAQSWQSGADKSMLLLKFCNNIAKD